MENMYKMKNGAYSFLVAVFLSVSAVASDTVYSWRGEKAFVWRDVTNTAACAVLVSPSSSCPFAKVGLAMPVLGDDGILYRDRVVYGVSTLVQPGDFMRLVAELEIPRRGDVPCVFAIESSLGKEEWNIVVSGRQFPEGRSRRVFLDLWQHPWAVARYFQVEPFSPAHYERMRPLWEQLADAGQKVITTTIMNRPWAHQCFDAYGSMVRHIRKSDGTWKFDYSLFDEYVTFAEKCGLGPQIHCYSIFPFRLKRYYWEDEGGHEMFGDFDVGSKEFTDYWSVFLDDFAAHLKKKGWFERTYIAMDERSPEDLKAASNLVKAYGRFKVAMAGDRPPSLFDGIEIDNFSIALQCVTPKYMAETAARRGKGRTTSVYVAGGNPCTGTAQPPIDCMWLGAYPGAMDLDGFLRWAYCSWPADPDSDTTYSPWFGRWSAGGTYLVYPNGPSVRFLALRNGLNLSEKIGILRAEGRIDSNLAAILKEFQYKGPKKYPSPPVISDLIDRTAQTIHRLSADASSAFTSCRAAVPLL